MNMNRNIRSSSPNLEDNDTQNGRSANPLLRMTSVQLSLDSNVRAASGQTVPLRNRTILTLNAQRSMREDETNIPTVFTKEQSPCSVPLLNVDFMHMMKRESSMTGLVQAHIENFSSPRYYEAEKIDLFTHTPTPKRSPIDSSKSLVENDRKVYSNTDVKAQTRSRTTRVEKEEVKSEISSQLRKRVVKTNTKAYSAKTQAPKQRSTRTDLPDKKRKAVAQNAKNDIQIQKLLSQQEGLSGAAYKLKSTAIAKIRREKITRWRRYLDAERAELQNQLLDDILAKVLSSQQNQEFKDDILELYAVSFDQASESGFPPELSEMKEEVYSSTNRLIQARQL